MDLALNNLQRLICHKTQQTNKQTNKKITNYSYRIKYLNYNKLIPVEQHFSLTESEFNREDGKN